MKTDAILDISPADTRDDEAVLCPDRRAEAGIAAWLLKETIAFPHATIWFDEAHAACSLWCELRGFAKPSAETFWKAAVEHGCEIDRERSLAGSQKHYQYVITHLRIGRGAFSESTLRAFESQRRRRAAMAKAAR